MLRPWPPAADNVREVIATYVDVGAIDKDAVADITIAPPIGTVWLVGPYDDVAIFGQANDIIPITRRVGHFLATRRPGHHEVSGVR